MLSILNNLAVNMGVTPQLNDYYCYTVHTIQSRISDSVQFTPNSKEIFTVLYKSKKIAQAIMNKKNKVGGITHSYIK